MTRAGSLLHAHADEAAHFAVTVDDLISRLDRLGPGDLLTAIGLDSSGLRAAAEARPLVHRHMLELDLAGIGSTTQAVGRILDDLADLALGLWPNWAAHSADPAVLAAWRGPAARLAAAGRPPRFRGALPRVELRQLLAAIDPDGLVLVATIDPAQPRAASAQIAALEWCAGVGAGVVALCSTRPPTGLPFDRILYGALEIAPRASAPVLNRLIIPKHSETFGSYTEKRVRLALRDHPELKDLFEDEVTLNLGSLGPAPRVDLLWRAGRVVVELDGFEHERRQTYEADRHRDYELLVAGYLVLRLTNSEIETDLSRAIDKICRVVRFRRGGPSEHVV